MRKDILLSRNGHRGVQAVVDGRTYSNVRIRRALPLSHPGRYISVLDENGDEICMIRDPDSLPDATRRVLEQELERTYITSLIRSIHSVRSESASYRCDVETNRGRRTFILQNPDENTLWAGPNRLLIVDIHGSRYEIADTGSLDARSNRYLRVLAPLPPRP